MYKRSDNELIRSLSDWSPTISTAGPESYKLSTLARGLKVLFLVAERAPLSVNQIAGLLELNRTTTVRTLAVLEEFGLIRRDEAKDYRPAVGLLRLSASASQQIGFVHDVRPDLKRISDTLQRTVHVGTLRESEIFVIDKMDHPSQFVRYSSVGSKMPLHCTAMGKAALAEIETHPYELLGPDPWDAYTAETITELGALRTEIAEVRKAGYAIDRAEYQQGFECVGVAVRSQGEIYTVSVTGIGVLDGAREHAIKELLDIRERFQN